MTDAALTTDLPPTAIPLLEITHLRIESGSRNTGPITLVDGVQLVVRAGEIVGLVGESGCGKSLTLLSILGLLPPGVDTVEPTSATIDGRDVSLLSEAEFRSMRGDAVTLVPSDAGAALDPVARVGAQLERVLMAHSTMSRRARRARVLEMLGRVHLPNPAQQVRKFPHQLSGGMQQRVAIAAALLNSPRLILADEPTTALDMTVQAQVLRLLLEVRDTTDVGVLFVTHDLPAVTEICDRVVVMYAGQVVEEGEVTRIVRNPRHPYTRALMGSVPPLDGGVPDRLTTIPGSPPAAGDWPEGCRFRARCELYERLGRPELCATARPMLSPESSTACHFWDREGKVSAW